MEARAQAAEQDDAPAVVVGAEGWHHGVVGIIAARLVDQLARPAIAIGFKNGDGRGSARTVPGVNLFEALGACSTHLTRFGGHAGAAGMSIAVDQLGPFRTAFAAEAARQLAGRTVSAVEVDAEVMLGDLDLPFAEELARLAPFGAANREPLFALRGVTTRATRVVGKGHLQLTLDHDGTVSDAIAFGFGDEDPGPGAVLDLVATAELDTFRGTRRTRLRVTKLARRPNAD